MTYAIYDTNGYVADAGSVCGYNDLLKFVETQTGIPYLKRFMEKGMTENQDSVIDDIKMIIPKVSDITIRTTLLNLAVSLKNSKDIAIVSE